MRLLIPVINLASKPHLSNFRANYFSLRDSYRLNSYAVFIGDWGEWVSNLLPVYSAFIYPVLNYLITKCLHFHTAIIPQAGAK